MAKKLLYVYCATRGSVPPGTLAKLPPMPDADKPRLLPIADTLSLVVADVPAESYQAAAIEARLGDLDWVARCGAAHHGVIEALGRKRGVVPFRLFTLFSSAARARSTLARKARRIADALDKVTAKREWALKISKPDPALTAARNAADSPAPPQATGTSFLQRKAAAKQAAREASDRVRGAAADLFDRLAEIAEEATFRSVSDTPSLLLDAAFLVDVRRHAQFKRALTDAAATLLEDGCRVSLTGPWPPYSFVTLETGPSHV